MKRSLNGALAIVALAGAMPAMAADYDQFPELRPAYPDSWEMGEDNPLHFEAGIRYWYSIGGGDYAVGARSQRVDTKTHSGEAFARIDDDSTSSYVEATAGYAFASEGTYSNNGGPEIGMPNARLGYAGLDFGWLPFGDVRQGYGIGAVIGYQYTNDSPDTGRANFTTAATSDDISWSDSSGSWSIGFDSKANDVNIHASKLGIAGRVELGDMVDLTGEAAAIPYAWVNGTLGAHDVDPFFGANSTTVKASETTINGFAYGATGKLMVGFHPTENLTIRLGGRATYMQGNYDATWDEATVTHPQANPLEDDGSLPDPRYSAPTLTRQGYISTNNPFSMFRYGALVEVAGRF